ncbi:MAG: ABC transporter substrate-binding protein [Chloroflexota bacterium]
MKRSLSLFSLLLMTSLLVILPVSAQEVNLTDECVAEYDPEVDYFPEKVEVNEAENFAVEYFNNYKIVTVTDAFAGADPFTYVLVQCGTPAPETAELPDNTQFIEVPTGDFIAMSTTQVPHLIDLDLLDNLVGLDSTLFVNSPEVVELIEADELIEVGSGSDVNVELVLETEPDIVMTFGFDPASDAHPILIEAGIFTALNAEWREATPLARAEWIKYTALFYNAEAAGTEAYDDISTAYEEARELAASIPEDERPTVLWNTFSSFSEAWLIPGAETYTGVLIQDAGGQIALGEEAPAYSAFVGFEPVYDGALDADVWVTNLFGVTTLDGLLAQDERYADFSAAQNGNVWNNSLDVNENGGNNYFELGVTNPHLILQDLVAIFHPELVPDHEFTFFEPLLSEE